ncbi:hypothetical protein [Nocardia sp. NPDC050435]|uniref:hypothetical protein n=1 Tax=Nocardia sp. NPDC050435 TaxID=3155040 RepID=UPI0033C00589
MIMNWYLIIGFVLSLGFAVNVAAEYLFGGLYLDFLDVVLTVVVTIALFWVWPLVLLAFAGWLAWEHIESSR